MADRSDEFRRAALDCLRLARSTTDERRRSALLLMAQRWSDLAIEPGSKGVLDRAVQAHNERQMTPARVTQQQQQIQPKAEDTGD